MPVFPAGYPAKSNPIDEDKVLIADSENGDCLASVDVGNFVWDTDNIADAAVTADKIDFATLKTDQDFFNALNTTQKYRTEMISLNKTGYISFTGWGFKPRKIEVHPAVISGANGISGTGLAVDNLNGTISQASVSEGVSASNLRSTSDNTAFLVSNWQKDMCKGTVVSFDNDGITVNCTYRTNGYDRFLVIASRY